MMRSGKKFALTALLAAAVLAAPAATRAADTNKTDTQKTLEDIQAQLSQIQKELRDLRTDLGTISNAGKAEINALNHRIDDLERRLDSLRPPQGYTSGFRGPENPEGPRMGVVQIRNRYGSPATVTINDRPYVVPPFERATIELPAGPFTYRVTTAGQLAQPTVNRNLTPDSVFRITIFPRTLPGG